MMRMNQLLFSRNNLIKQLFFACFCVAMTAVADAGTIVAPTGLLPGTQFRVIFVTAGKMNSTSTDIHDYDNFVNAQAMNASYEGHKVHFSAIASLSSTPSGPAITNAITHINDGISSSAGVYMVDGTKVADNTGISSGGLFSGSVMATPRQGIDGTSYNDVNIWTGSAGNGNAYNTTFYGLYGLGSLNRGVLLSSPLSFPYFLNPMAMTGHLGKTDPTGYSWLSTGGIPGLEPTSIDLQLYGISDILTATAPAVIPEPSCLTSLCIGALVLVIPRAFRRRVLEPRKI